MEFVIEDLKYDKEFIREILSIDSSILDLIPQELQKDKDIVLAAVSNNGLALQYASEELRNDMELVCYAIMQNIEAVDYIGKEIRRPILIEAFKTYIKRPNNNSVESAINNGLSKSKRRITPKYKKGTNN